MHNVLRLALVLGCLSACGGPHYVYYPTPPANYRHFHRLDCGHEVECRYYGGAHHFTPHRRHDHYWHVHWTEHGYKRCYVEQRRHAY